VRGIGPGCPRCRPGCPGLLERRARLTPRSMRRRRRV
jgi:hypothetical protein